MDKWIRVEVGNMEAVGLHGPNHELTIIPEYSIHHVYSTRIWNTPSLIYSL